MKHKRTLCIAANYHDKEWIEDYLIHRNEIEEIIFFAPTLEGQLLLDSMSIEYINSDEFSYKLDYSRTFSKAAQQSLGWIKNITNLREFQLISKFSASYPLIEMHQSLILLSFWEVIEAWEFTTSVIEKSCPDKIVYQKRDNPFMNEKDRLFALVGSNSLEREVAKSYAISHNIEFLEIESINNDTAKVLAKISRKLTRKIKSFTKNPRILIDKILSFSMIKHFKNQINRAKIESLDICSKKKTIMFYVYAYYYLDYLMPVFKNILSQGEYKIIVCITGGKLDAKYKKFFEFNQIPFFEKAIFQNKTNKVNRKIKDLINSLIQKIQFYEPLISYFSDSKGNYFYPMIFHAIERELLSMTRTLDSLQATEKILDKFIPDLIIYHFHLHANDVSNILPARRRGIPTLSLPHGFAGYSNNKRNTFSTEYYAEASTGHKNALAKFVDCSLDKIIVTGNTRVDFLPHRITKEEAKKQFNISRKQQVAIFCDSSGWLQTNEWRHTTKKTLEEVIRLTNIFPEILFIYRVHHGINYSNLKEYLERLNIKNLSFQVSPNPQLMDIVQAANFTISHHSSAITESLLMGVPVIYLCALSKIDQMYVEHQSQVLKIAQKFDCLPSLINEYIANDFSSEYVLQVAESFFKKTLYNDEQEDPSYSLTKAIINLANLSKAQKNSGFQDWLNRINFMCNE